MGLWCHDQEHVVRSRSCQYCQVAGRGSVTVADGNGLRIFDLYRSFGWQGPYLELEPEIREDHNFIGGPAKVNVV